MDDAGPVLALHASQAEIDADPRIARIFDDESERRRPTFADPATPGLRPPPAASVAENLAAPRISTARALVFACETVEHPGFDRHRINAVVRDLLRRAGRRLFGPTLQLADDLGADHLPASRMEFGLDLALARAPVVGIENDALDRFQERALRVHVEIFRECPARLRQRSDVGNDRDLAEAERLGHGQPPALVEAGIERADAPLIELAQHDVGDIRKDHDLAHELVARRQARMRLAVQPAALADAHQFGAVLLAVTAQKLEPRRERQRVVLARLDRGHEKHEAAALELQLLERRLFAGFLLPARGRC